MVPLKKFEEFLNSGVVRKQTPDGERAKSLIIESKEKLKFFEKVKERLGTEELSPNYVIETCYDVLIELLRAKLLTLGYKTDSHETEVSYMKNLGFSEQETDFMNQLRYFRNGIKYYGKILNQEYSTKVMKFMYKTIPKLN